MSEYTLLDIKRPQKKEPDFGNMTLLGINMPSEPVKEEKSGVITELGRGLIEGVAGMGETAGTLMKIVSGDKGKAGPWLEEKSRTFADKFRMPEDLQGSVVDSPGLLLEPRWWAHGVGQVAGSMAAPIGVGGTAAKGANALFKKILTNPQSIARATKYTGIGAAGATGGAMEGTQTYNSVLEETGDKNKALKAGSLMALGSAALNSLSFGKMLSQKTKSKIAHIIASGVTEGATEQAEEPWEAIVSGHPEQAVDAWIDGFNVFFPSLIVGGLGGAGGAQLSKDAKNTLSNDEMVEVKNAIKETAQEKDLSPEEKEYVDWWLSEIEKAEAEKGPMEEWASTTPRWVTEAEAEAEHLEAQRDFGQGKLRDRLAMEEEMYGRDYPALPKPDVMYQEGEAEPQGLIGQQRVPMIESKTLALPKPEAIHLPDQSVLNLPDMSVSDILSKREQILKHSDMTPDDLNQLIIDKQSRKFETGEIEKPETAMRSEATRLGLEYVGIQEGVRGSLHLFTDPQNGSTFAVPEGESVDAALRGNRERFAPKTPVGETGDTTVQPKAEEATDGGNEQETGALEGEKEPWEIPVGEYANRAVQRVSGQSVPKTRKMARTYHSLQVHQALSENKPVPTEVLKDYPDLKPVVSNKTDTKPVVAQKTPETGHKEVDRRVVDGRVRTESGRWIPAPPRIRFDSERKALNDIRKQDKWLKDQALAEAKSRNDEYNTLQFEGMRPGKMSPADKDSASMYLFGDPHAEFEVEQAAPQGKKAEPKPSATESATTSTTSLEKQAEGSGKAKAGYVWIKEKQRPFTTYREILRGKNKGMYRVTVGGKGYLVDKGKIARFPEGALDKEISKANIAVDEQRAVTRKSLKKDHPDWSAQRVEDELAKTVRAGEEAGVSEANERAGKPVKKRLFEKKAVGAETASPTAKREPVAQKPKTVIESRQKKTPDLTATFPSSYSKTPREVLGKNSLWKVVSKDGKVVETEYATHPHILIVMDKKDRDAIGYQGKTPQGRDAVVSKEVVDSQLKSFKKRGTEVKTIEIAKYAERDDWGILSDGNIEVAVNPKLIGMVKRQHPNAVFYLNGPEVPIAAFDGKEWKALIMPWRGTDFESVRKDAETIIEVPASAKVGKASSPPRPQGATVPKKQNVITGTIREKVDEAIKKAPEIDSDDLLRLDEIRDFKPSKWESDDAGKKRGAEDREFYDSLKKKYGTIEITSPTGQGWKYNIINTKHHLGNFKKQIEKLEKGKEGIALFRKSDPTNTGIPIPAVNRSIDPILSKWKGAPKIVVTNSKDTKIPKGLMRQMGDAEGVAGAFYEDTVYLFHDNIDSIEDAQKTILHESAHWGPRRMFGRSFDRFLRGVLRSADKGVLDKVAKLYDCDMTKVPDRMLAAEEYVAHISETGQDAKTWNRFTSYVKQWLIKRGFTVKLSDDEIRAIVSRGREGTGTVFTKDGRMRAAAYHGSPHTFDKFSTEKIGTGEGAQAYGHGLYFAGAKEVAEFYRDTLSKGELLTVKRNGKIIAQGDTVSDDLLDAYKFIEMGRKQAQYPHLVAYTAKHAADRAASGLPGAQAKNERVKKLIDEYADAQFSYERPPSHLYEVELAPEEDEYLLWDKPLSEQSEKVKKILLAANPDLGNGTFKDYLEETGDVPDGGRGIYTLLSDTFRDRASGQPSNDKAASEYLHSLGIRGIKYLDGTSRGKGEGAYNYVIFSDEDVNIKARFRKVTDPATLARLESGKTIKVFRAMQVIDGKLYPPMSASIGNKLRDATEIGIWEQAVESPELADDKGRFKLEKGNKKSITARYNPYFHTSRSPLNDQFSEAYNRPNLVTVEAEVPVSELTSGYRAENAKDAVGEMAWHSGPVSSKLPASKARKVILSRYAKVVRIVPDSEVAEHVAELLRGEDIAVPEHVITPSLKRELLKRGVNVMPRQARFRKKSLFDKKGPGDKTTEATPLPDGLVPNQSRPSEKGGSAKFRKVTDAVPEASIETDEQANKFTDAIENWLATAKIPFISHTRKDIENLGSTRDLPLAKRLDNMGLKGIQRKNIISKLVSDITGEKLENVTLDELTPKGKALVHNFLDNVQLDPYGKAIIEEVENHHGVKLTKKFVDGVDDFRDLNKAHIFTLQPYRAADFVDPSGELYKQTVIPAEDANHKIREEFDGLQKKLRELMPGAKKGSRVSAMLQDYAEGRLDLGKIPERWRGHIRETSVWAREVYDENLERVNKARVQAGKSEIKRRDDYFTHGAELSFLTEFFGGAHKIPNEIAKISHLTHPNSPYFKYEFRKGGEFNSDGIGNFLAWNDNALKTIHNTPVLLNARAYIKHLPPNAFRYFTSWSDEVLAGKTSPIDKAIPAPLLKGWTWLRHRMVKNIIIGSARIAVQQPSTFAVTFAELATGRASTLGDVARNIQDTFWAFGHSFTKAGQDFCSKNSREYRDRMYIEDFDPGMLNSLEYKVQFINMKLDQIMVGQAFLGKARQLIRQGMDPEEAYIEADKTAKKTNASYQKINLPPILRANMGKNLLPIQTFTFNFMHHAGMDTLGLKNTRGKKVALAKGLTLMAACMAINELYEGLHMRPTWDFMSLIPGLGYLKYGVSGPLGVIHSMYKYAAGDQSGTSFGRAMGKAAWQIAPPFGGEQIRKSIDGYKTITNPDEKPYKINNDWDRLMAVVFGPGSSMQAVEYWEARNNSPLKKLMDGANKKHSRTQRRSRRTRQDRR